jgi:hypothetical protein
VLDAVLTGEVPSVKTTSMFTQGIETLSELLLQAQSIPVWLLSYGNQMVDLIPIEGCKDMPKHTRI